MEKIDFKLILMILYICVSLYIFTVSLIMIIKPNLYFKNSNFRKYTKGFFSKDKEYTHPSDIRKNGYLLLTLSFLVLLFALEMYSSYSIQEKIRQLVERVEKISK